MSDYHDKVIQELQTDLDKHKWISIDDKSPEVGDRVLALTSDTMWVCDIVYTGVYNQKAFEDGYGYYVTDATHWMPLPNLPENIIYDRVGDDEESDAE